MERPPYEYLPLQQDDSFRTIILHPSPNESDPIACTILRERLSDESIEYEAVSYTWGDNTQTNKIHLNGDTEQIIGRNCHAALRRLRRSDEDRTIWIDAICINQNDLNERSRQVRLMNEIYTLAAGVMVMLSDQVPDCRLLLREVATPKTSGSPQPTRTVLKQLEELFEDPWFKRTWVLQEIYKKKNITVMYGSATIPLHVLEGICYGYPRGDGNAMKLTRGVLPHPLGLLWTSQIEYSTLQFNLWNRLYISRECLASNPRDKVFALKSLLGYKQSDIDYLIDYTQTLEALFKRVAKFLLPVMGPRIFAAIRHPHTLDIPSWMPDWSQTLPLHPIAFQFESEKARILRNPAVSATPEDHDRTLESYSCKDHTTGSQLHVTGCRYAQVVKSSQAFHFLDADDADRQMLNVYNDFVNRASFLDAKGKRKLAPSSTLSHFGRKIFHGKHTKYLGSAQN